MKHQRSDRNVHHYYSEEQPEHFELYFDQDSGDYWDSGKMNQDSFCEC